MKSPIIRTVLPALLWQGISLTLFAQAQPFVFKFEAGHSLNYALQSDTEIDMETSIPGQTEAINMIMRIKMRYNIKLTSTGGVKNHVNTVSLEPSNIEVDWDIEAPTGNIVMNLRGADMTGTANGTAFIDTQQGIGVAEANQIKGEIAGLYMAGEMDIDATGKVAEMRGDSIFIKFWTTALQSQIGFFGVIFPRHSVAPGENWAETLTLKKLGDFHVNEPGMACTATFFRQPDTTLAEHRLSRFNFEAPISYKNLSGYINQRGQRMQANFESFERSASGAINFDLEKGRLLESNAMIAANALLSMGSGGEAATTDMTIGITMNLRLLPNSARVGQ